jgi:hypothetical protein
MPNEIPEFFSQKRAMHLSGAGRKRVERLAIHGPFKQVSRGDCEHVLMQDRKITPELWDKATLSIAATHEGRP